eukprot:10349081-Lingulodinium_polyedra.AAC.1
MLVRLAANGALRGRPHDLALRVSFALPLDLVDALARANVLVIGVLPAHHAPTRVPSVREDAVEPGRAMVGRHIP